ncbi:hypothetical protein ACLKA6_007379 [Drosophila palustris]
MHGTWYKGPQLAHHPHTHTEYHQFRSYPSFVVTPYHDGHAATPCPPTPCTPCSSSHHAAGLGQNANEAGPIIVEGTFAATAAAAAAAAAAVGGCINPVTVTGAAATPSSLLSPPIKIEQVFGEASATSLGAGVVEDYALNLDCPVEHQFRDMP